MKCRCGAETRVVDSRLHKDDPTIIVRRRACTACETRFTTQEGTVDIAAQRAKRRAHWKRKPVADKQEKTAAYAARRRLLDASRAEARETGVSVDLVRARWGISNSSMSPSIG